MPLPPIIEIVPPPRPVTARVAVPGSKSVTNRSLILAALAEGRTTLHGALWSEDTQVMVECLLGLGFRVEVTPDAAERCNRTIVVEGGAGRVPAGGSWGQPKNLYVGNAGTAARFLAAFVCLGEGVYRLHGTPRMHERPQAELLAALRQLGYEIESEADHDKLPVKIRGGALPRLAETGQPSARQFAGPKRGKCVVSIGESSQFASALLLCAEVGGWQVEVLGQNEDESSYVAMTREMVKVFPRQGGDFAIEADASSGSYFIAADLLLAGCGNEAHPSPTGMNPTVARSRGSSVANWPCSGWQIDEQFPAVMARTFALREPPGLEGVLRSESREGVVSRQTDLGDSIMTAIALAPLGLVRLEFTDLGRLRLQECERVSALRTELTKCGAQVTETDDTLAVLPSAVHGAEIETYNDHRMAMCFAILGLIIPGIRLKNPSCVKKTFPDFFQKLAARPPRGLGATILDARDRRPLSSDELFAE